MEKNMPGGIHAVHFIKAFVISAVITAVLLFLCAFLLLKTGMEDKTLQLFIAAVDALAVFAGGVYLGRTSGKQKYLWGLIFGVLYFLIYLVVVFCMNGTEVEAGSLIKTFLVMAAGGMVGGMIS